MDSVKEFTIDRKKWVRGRGSFDTHLRNLTDGRHCCLGFFSKACGFKNEDILELSSIEDLAAQFGSDSVRVKRVLFSAGQMNATSTFWQDLYAINDDEIYSDAEREELITAKFAAVGITVHFKG